MAIDILPIQEQTNFPIEKKPSVDPAEKAVYSDVFALQNAFRILFFVLDATFQQIEDAVNTGLAGSGIPEAPMDGQKYARKNGTWVVIP